VTITESVREYICADLAADVGREDLTPDFPLIDNGVLDSISTYRLAGFLAERFHVAIEDADMTYRNLQSLEAITAMVEAKLHAAGPVAPRATTR
jgi:acyl carrier protein